MQSIVPRYLVYANNRIRLYSQKEEILLNKRVKIKIGLQLEQIEKNQIINLLENNLSVFTKNSNICKGIDRNIVEHHLDVSPSKRPVKQRMRQLKCR